MKSLYTFTSFNPKIQLDTYLGINSKIALKEIAFQMIANNVGSDDSLINNYVKFNLTITKKKSKQLYPELTVILPPGRYTSLYRVKKILYHNLRKLTIAYGDANKYFIHFFTRIHESNGCFYIKANYSSKRYNMDLEFGKNIKQFLNLSTHKLFIKNDNFLNDKTINYSFNKELSIHCDQIDNTVFASDQLKYMYINNVNFHSIYYREIRNLEYKDLKKQRFNELSFYTSENVKIVYLTCEIISKD